MLMLNFEPVVLRLAEVKSASISFIWTPFFALVHNAIGPHGLILTLLCLDFCMHMYLLPIAELRG